MNWLIAASVVGWLFTGVLLCWCSVLRARVNFNYEAIEGLRCDLSRVRWLRMGNERPPDMQNMQKQPSGFKPPRKYVRVDADYSAVKWRAIKDIFYRTYRECMTGLEKAVFYVRVMNGIADDPDGFELDWKSSKIKCDVKPGDPVKIVWRNPDKDNQPTDQPSDLEEGGFCCDVGYWMCLPGASDPVMDGLIHIPFPSGGGKCQFGAAWLTLWEIEKNPWVKEVVSTTKEEK